MAFHGAAEKLDHRTGRKRAIEIGTKPGGFEGAPGYDAQAGIPEGKGTPSSEVHDKANDDRVKTSSPVKEKTPFKLEE
jgi:hypothetical protein